ncbi:PREDICTED: zinc finger protein 839 [Chrysochloris asiatica]|uniref:Zinc finger protein 839 n=1 Tax=Chrysochloris asiatica TaxID=185453 RepID=A0A9B0T4Z2_CHRAS|nr:PREDICTED: zinc finger protein 839 [Chrysochloris asiatica]
MANAEPEAEEGSEDGSGCRAPLSQRGNTARVAPLDPEQLRRVLEQVSKAHSPAKSPLPPPPPPPPFVLQDAARRLRDAAQQAALQRGPGAELPRPPRLLPPQQLEAIRVKVTSGDTAGQERPLPPLATVQPRTWRPSPLAARSPSLAGPQLLRAQPLLKTGPQPCHLSSSPQPPVQVFVQRPLPALSAISVKRVTVPKAPSGEAAGASQPALPSISPGSANASVSDLHIKQTEKIRKSLEVKTRSGRISRPPKYKAKDYRFIKTEDLADGHPSDSDDYSELNVEEDEEQRGKGALFDTSPCSLRPKTFKCQTCEKSYIGRGGLARHFKLNPGHGQLQTAELLPERARGHSLQGHTEDGTTSPVPPELSTPSIRSEERALQTLLLLLSVYEINVVAPVFNSVSLVNQRSPNSCQCLKLTSWGFGAPSATSATAGSLSWTSLVKAPLTAQVTRGIVTALSFTPLLVPTLSQPSGHVLTVKKLGVFRDVKHLLLVVPQQCGREEVTEVAPPELTPVVTVYEFLLMKVARSRLAKPLFPAVYKEFEELHTMVKKLCQDYLRSASHSSLEPLEIHNTKVAESLGITEELLREREVRLDSLPGRCGGHEADRAEAGRRKREGETPDELLVSVKRTRRETVPQDATEPLAVPNGSQERPRTMCVPAVQEAICCNLQVNGHASYPGPVSGDSLRLVGQLCGTLADVGGHSGSADSMPLPQGAIGLAQDTQEHSGQHAGGRLLCPSLDSSSVSSGGPGALLLGGVQNAGASPSPITLTDVPALFPEAEPADQASKTAAEPGLPPDLDKLPAASRGLGSHMGGCGLEEHAEQTELENIVAVGETLALEIASGGHQLFPQGQEQIFIPTANGLVLSHPGTLVTGEEDVVIVTTVEGPALQAGLPVEVFLAEGGESCP